MRNMRLSTTKRRERRTETPIAKRVLYRRNNKRALDYRVKRVKLMTIKRWRYDIRRNVAEHKLGRRLQKKIDMAWKFIAKRYLGRKFREWQNYYHRYQRQEDMAYRWIRKATTLPTPAPLLLKEREAEF